MRIDAVSIFPEYLAPLDLSLVGRARRSGLLDVRVHDLRDWTEDKHRTTDDTPYGGGAGMVMKPEPWGKALDAVAPSAAGASPPLLVVPTPSGRPFTQELAERLSRREWLVFACGRYEGIDQRVIDDAGTRMEVLEVSIGDYVLNGGEVAALVVIEAVVRLLPGFMGNPKSLSEESHAAGEGGRLLEYPVYTRPASWRGLDVPEVLLGGDHTRIASWRHDLAVRRTARRRPDLAHGSQSLDVSEMDGLVRVAEPADAPEILTLQRACWMQEAMVNDTLHIPPLLESLDDVRAGLGQWTTFVVRSHGRLVASVRGRLNVDVWEVGRLMVAPDLQGRGLGRWLLEYAEKAAPPGTAGFSLFTGAGSADNLRMYRRAGYRRRQDDLVAPGVVVLTKRRREPR